LNQKVLYQNKTYTCTKSGKKLVWNKGIVVKKQTQSPTPTPSVTKSSDNLSNSPCDSLNRVIVNAAGEFWCLKIGDTLRWSKNNQTPTPTPTPTTVGRAKQKTSPVTYMPPSMPSGRIEDCKIKEVSRSAGSGARSGFPRIDPPLYANSGIVKWALVPIDFRDLPGEADFMNRVQEQMELSSAWIEMVTEGKVKIVWQVQKDWIRLPGVSKDYEVALSGTVQRPEIANLWNTFMFESDKVVNYRDVQAVHFVLPKNQTVLGEAAKGYAWDPVVRDYTTNEGSKIGFFTIPGVFYDRSDIGRTYWSYWVKEYTRGLGAGVIGAQRVSSSFQTYDIQGSTDGERELTAWFRFLLGWLPDEKIYCQQASNISTLDVTLVPLPVNSKSGIKMVVIPLSDSKAIIIESRRETKFACLTPTQRNGVLVYLYDAKFGNTEEFFTAIVPSGRNVERYSCAAVPSVDPLLHEGELVTFEGVTIQLLLHGDFDRIRISR
jgi:hypothetical protein